jgi:hypothetical protein
MEHFYKPSHRNYVFSVRHFLSADEKDPVLVEASIYDNKEGYQWVNLEFFNQFGSSSIYDIKPDTFCKSLSFNSDNSGENVLTQLLDDTYVLTFNCYGNHQTTLKLPLSFMDFMQSLDVILKTHSTF